MPSAGFFFASHFDVFEASAPDMTEFIRTEIRGRIGFITLTRPKALNALSHDMIRAMASALDAWRDDPKVLGVVLQGEGEKGLCAGGDIRYFHEAVSAGRTDIMDFFTDEYRLNYAIATYPKPYIALMDGVVMGGGMGISQGAALRIVTEATRMAMPETAIGLFPDVGGGYFLANLAGHLGEYLGTTGIVFGAVDACEIGLADVVLPRALLPVLCDRLANGAWGDSDAVLDAARTFVRESLPPAGLAPGKGVGALNLARYDAGDALASFVESCPRLTAREDASGLTRKDDWRPACQAATGWDRNDAARFFATYFETAVVGDGETFATGYYEPEIAGVRTRQSGYDVPVYALPPDLTRGWYDDLPAAERTGQIVPLNGGGITA